LPLLFLQRTVATSATRLGGGGVGT